MALQSRNNDFDERLEDLHCSYQKLDQMLVAFMETIQDYFDNTSKRDKEADDDPSGAELKKSMATENGNTHDQEDFDNCVHECNKFDNLEDSIIENDNLEMGGENNSSDKIIDDLVFRDGFDNDKNNYDVKNVTLNIKQEIHGFVLNQDQKNEGFVLDGYIVDGSLEEVLENDFSVKIGDVDSEDDVLDHIDYQLIGKKDVGNVRDLVIEMHDTSILEIRWVILEYNFLMEKVEKVVPFRESFDPGIGNQNHIIRDNLDEREIKLINGDCLDVIIVGDFRALLSRGGQVVQMSMEHEHNTEGGSSERWGDLVSNLSGDVLRVNGQMAISRAYEDPYNFDSEDPDSMRIEAVELFVIMTKFNMVDLLVDATEDTVCGTIDVDKALIKGVMAFEPRLFPGDANGNESEKLVFSSLRQLKEYSIVSMVCLLHELRPHLSRGDAMWCLLMSDLNVGCAQNIEMLVIPFPDDGIMVPVGDSNVENVGANGVNGGADGVPPSGLCGFHDGIMQMYLQAQLKNFIIIWLTTATFLLHVLLSWLFDIVLEFGLPGAFCPMIISCWSLVISEFVYIFGRWCSETWTGFSFASFSSLWPVIKLSVSSGVMICLELWYNSVLVLLAGYMENTTVTISTFSSCLNIAAGVLMIGLGFLVSTSVQLSNELGKENPKAAKFSIKVIFSTATCFGLVCAIVCSIFSYQIAELFTSSEAVDEYVSKLSILLSISVFLNIIQPVLTGVTIGAGRQGVVAFVNIGCCYLIGVPIGSLLAYVGRDIECPKRFDLSPSMKSLLKRNVAAFAAGFRAKQARHSTTMLL